LNISEQVRNWHCLKSAQRAFSNKIPTFTGAQLTQSCLWQLLFNYKLFYFNNSYAWFSLDFKVNFY